MLAHGALYWPRRATASTRGALDARPGGLGVSGRLCTDTPRTAKPGAKTPQAPRTVAVMRTRDPTPILGRRRRNRRGRHANAPSSSSTSSTCVDPTRSSWNSTTRGSARCRRHRRGGWPRSSTSPRPRRAVLLTAAATDAHGTRPGNTCRSAAGRGVDVTTRPSCAGPRDWRARCSITDSVIYEPGCGSKPAPAPKVLATLCEPYFDRLAHFCSHNPTPPAKATDWPVAILKGKVGYIPTRIFSLFGVHGALCIAAWCRRASPADGPANGSPPTCPAGPRSPS